MVAVKGPAPAPAVLACPHSCTRYHCCASTRCWDITRTRGHRDCLVFDFIHSDNIRKLLQPICLHTSSSVIYTRSILLPGKTYTATDEDQKKIQRNLHTQVSNLSRQAYN